MSQEPNEMREDGPAIAKLLGAIDKATVLQSGPKKLLLPQGTERPAPAAEPAPAAIRAAPESDTPAVDVGPINYGMHLHQSGEAATQIVKNMVEAEAAYGNLRAIPEPILGWYCMTLTYELCVLEAVLAPYDKRKAHAEALQAARTAFTKYQESDYAKGVMAEIAEVLQTRFRPKGLEGERADYRGVLL